MSPNQNSKTMSFKSIALVAIILLLDHQTHAKPTADNLSSKNDAVIKTTNLSFNELNDLNKPTKNEEENFPVAYPFVHLDEDSPRKTTNRDLDDFMKYDVEMLEVRDIKKETPELEERFRGPSMIMNTDTFMSQNIEMNAAKELNAEKQANMVLTFILLGVVFVSICLYSTLVVWRAYLDQRYGMRELLVNTDDDFRQASHNMNNNNNGNSNGNGNGNNLNGGRLNGLGHV